MTTETPSQKRTIFLLNTAGTLVKIAIAILITGLICVAYVKFH